MTLGLAMADTVTGFLLGMGIGLLIYMLGFAWEQWRNHRTPYDPDWWRDA